MAMSLRQFAERMEKSKSYAVTELFVSAIPSALYKDNAMNLPASAERDLYDACMGKFASDKDEDDYYKLAELIARGGPVYPLSPIIKPKDVAGLTLAGNDTERTLNMNELRAFAAEEIFGFIDASGMRINAAGSVCVKSVFPYVRRGGRITSIYRQSAGVQSIPAASASFINVIEGGAVRKIRLKGTLIIPVLKVPPEYRKFII